MKYSNFSAFEKHLASASPNHFADIYLILSKDAFARKQAVDAIVSFVLKEEPSHEFSLQVFDAERHSADAIFQELNAMVFFAKKRVIIVKNADSLDKAATVKFETYFLAPNPAVCLVIAAETLNRSTNFYKKAEKAGVVLDVAEEKAWEREKSVAEWLRSEASAAKKEISPAACLMIVKQLGTDQAILQGEFQKLICYVGDRPAIDNNDVAAICTRINVENAWQLGEAIFRRNAAEALRIGRNLLDEGTALIALLRQIRSQFQTEFQVCSILAKGGGPSEITQEFPYMRGAILERHMQMAGVYGLNHFKKGLLAIDETELRAKNSSADPELLADMLIIKLCSS